MDAADVATMQQHGYQKAVFPAVKHAVVTDFPDRNMLSCIFSVFRVYPMLREYVGECRGKYVGECRGKYVGECRGKYVRQWQGWLGKTSLYL